MAPLTFVVSPITHSENVILKKDGLEAFSFNNSGQLYSPTHVNPLIKLDALINYFSTNGGGFDGIRMYPGFFNENLIIIMCVGFENKYTPQSEKAYILFENGHYFNDDSLTSLVDDHTNQPKAQTYHTNYNSSIYINGIIPSPGPKTRISRFYKWSDILSLKSQNPTGYYIQIDIGFVNNLLAPIFNLRSSAGADENHEGFTTILHLKNVNGNSLIDPKGPYISGNYTMRYLEVGSPCPPLCGELHHS